MLWRRIRPGEEDEGPKTRILNVLQFTLKPGIDIHDESGSQRGIWESTVRYVGSVPGCCAIEWGSRCDNHPRQEKRRKRKQKKASVEAEEVSFRTPWTEVSCLGQKSHVYS